MFWDKQIIRKPPWGSVKAAFIQKVRQNHLLAGIDAPPLVKKRDTAQDVYTLYFQKEREKEKHL